MPEKKLLKLPKKKDLFNFLEIFPNFLKFCFFKRKNKRGALPSKKFKINLE
jgi:hypothetical protein